MRLVVLISGEGHTLQALIDATPAFYIVKVYANHPEANGLKRAQRAGIDTRFQRVRRGEGRRDDELMLLRQIQDDTPDWVVLAGWDHILGADFIDGLSSSILNLHPALPGEFPGLNAIERAWTAHQERGLNRSGAMVHEVIAEVDAGPILRTVELPFLPDDTKSSFTKRLKEAERELLIQSLRGLRP